MAKNRFWSFLLYPESASLEKCIELLEDLRIKACISPLHDRDLDREGNTKKAHYHVYLVYPNPISHNSVIDGICNPLGLNPYCLPLRDPGQAFLYLWHDSRNSKGKKALYNKEDITFLNGCNADDFPEKVKHKEELQKALFELRRDIVQNDILEFSDLVEWVENNPKPYYQELLIDKMWIIDKYITSKRHALGSKDYQCAVITKLKDEVLELEHVNKVLSNQVASLIGFVQYYEQLTGKRVVDSIYKMVDDECIIIPDIDYSKFF